MPIRKKSGNLSHAPRIYTHNYIYIYIYIYIYTHIYIWIYIYVCVCVKICIHIYRNIYTHIYMYTNNKGTICIIFFSNLWWRDGTWASVYRLSNGDILKAPRTSLRRSWWVVLSGFCTKSWQIHRQNNHHQTWKGSGFCRVCWSSPHAVWAIRASWDLSFR